MPVEVEGESLRLPGQHGSIWLHNLVQAIASPGSLPLRGRVFLRLRGMSLCSFGSAAAVDDSLQSGLKRVIPPALRGMMRRARRPRRAVT